MTYFETALEALKKKDILKATEYLEYAVKFGSVGEKIRARKMLSEKCCGHFSESILVDVPSLLKEKRYTEALHALEARERLKISPPEDFYYLGLLHDDFGMGLPNDKNKAREYYQKAWERRYAAGSIYIVMDRDWLEPLTEKQKKILECAGDSVARTILAMEEFKNSSTEENDDEETEDPFIKTLNEIIQQDGECGFAKFILSTYQLQSSKYPEDRYAGFQTLQTLKDHWNTDIASMATNAVAECYRDGVYVSQDFEEAEKHFREVLAFGKESGNESATEFLSGEWQEVPTEGLAEWHEEKIGECIKKLFDVSFLSKRDWILAESDEEIKSAAENFSPRKVYDWVCSEIEEAARFVETHLGIEDAKEKIDQRIHGELPRLKKALCDWKDVLMERLSILDRKEKNKDILSQDGKKDKVSLFLKSAGIGASLMINPIAGCAGAMSLFWDEYRKEKGRECAFNEKENELNCWVDQLSQKVEKVYAELNDAEVSLRGACIDVLFDFLKRDSKGSDSKSETRPDMDSSFIRDTRKEEKCEKAQIFCIECGEKNPEHANFCCACGAKLHK